MNKIHNIVGGFLTTPFREHFLFFFSLFLLATSPYILRQILAYENYPYAFYVATHCIVLTYLVTFAIGLIRPHIIRKIIQGILIVVSSILFALNVYCLFELGGLIDVDYIMLVLGTTPQEAKEFASVMLPKGIVAGVIILYLVLTVLWALSQQKRLHFGKKTFLAASATVCICALGNLHNWDIWQAGPIKHFSDLLNNLSQYDLPNEQQFNHALPAVIIDGNNKCPSNIVLVIGESFARFHSSLYGYDKLTNPRLGSFKDLSLLFTFDNIDAPAPTTSLALEYVLSTYSKLDTGNDKKKWYEYLTIIDLMKACGYDCYWFSNQARTGQFNYIARAFAESCTKNQFYQQEGTMRSNQKLDMVLVDSTNNVAKKKNPDIKRFIVYHLMGSHFDYSMRYPTPFAQFTEKDYASEPQQQRPILASYDNSILYNDFVIEQIINLYKDAETLVIYLPDHGLDMYRSSADYHAHGKINDPVSYAYGVEIPFMIYASPLYQEKHPEVMQRIKYRQEHPKAWNSDDLPYLIMDLIGVKDINGEAVKPKSVLD